MRNIFLFIRRFFTFFCFLVLQGVALWFLFNYNRFHRAKFLGVANEVTGRINTQYNKIEDYFKLVEENRSLHKLNDSLMNRDKANYTKPDTSVVLVSDTIPFDTLGNYHRYYYRSGTVVYNTVNSPKNYIQINRGSIHGIRDNMGVLSSDGSAVGVVVNVSPHFSQVMSLLNVKSTISASLKRSGEFGLLEWDGVDPRFLMLKRIPKTIVINPGDTIVTSNYSFSIPPGKMVGTVEEVTIDNATGLYALKVRTAANFNKLQQVHIVENLQYDEQVKLLEATKKKIDETKKTNQ
jgi:rod shape-determining protein MreC